MNKPVMFLKLGFGAAAILMSLAGILANYADAQFQPNLRSNIKRPPAFIIQGQSGTPLISGGANSPVPAPAPAQNSSSVFGQQVSNSFGAFNGTALGGYPGLAGAGGIVGYPSIGGFGGYPPNYGNFGGYPGFQGFGAGGFNPYGGPGLYGNYPAFGSPVSGFAYPGLGGFGGYPGFGAPAYPYMPTGPYPGMGGYGNFGGSNFGVIR